MLHEQLQTLVKANWVQVQSDLKIFQHFRCKRRSRSVLVTVCSPTFSHIMFVRSKDRCTVITDRFLNINLGYTFYVAFLPHVLTSFEFA